LPELYPQRFEHGISFTLVFITPDLFLAMHIEKYGGEIMLEYGNLLARVA